MDKRLIWKPICGLCLSLLLFSGCGDDFKLVPVTGTVTLDGHPLPKAEVVFRPTAGRPSLGITDDQGRYVLRYSPTEMGALPGRHTITISTVGDFVSSSDEDSPTNPKELVPAQYNAKSALEVDLDLNREGPVDFALVSKS